MARKQIPKTDWDLIEAIRIGSQDAFALIVSRYQRQIANLVYLSLGNRLDVEDLTQEVFFRFYQSLDRLDERETVAPWLYRIATNLCIDESRKRAMRRTFSLDFLIDEGRSDKWLEDKTPRADASLIAREKKQVVISALATLPAKNRIAVILRDYEDLTYREISEILGVTPQNVKTRLFRGRQQLITLLRPKP